jgi:hypothetical protein
MTTTNDGGPAHPMVMKAARGLCREVARQMEESDSELWAIERENLILAAQAALAECGALECFEALKRLSGEWAYQCSKGNVPEGRVEAEMADKAIAKARDVSSDGGGLRERARMSDTTNAGPVLPAVPVHIAAMTGAGGDIRAYGLQCWNDCDEHVAGPLRDQLGQCFRLSGADPDGNENWRLAPRAVDAVRQLRADYDETCDEAEKLRERVAELERDLLTLKAGAQKVENLCKTISDDRDRIRAECEALSDSLRECADDLESEVKARASGDLPRRIERDLEPARRARELLAARAAREEQP